MKLTSYPTIRNARKAVIWLTVLGGAAATAAAPPPIESPGAARPPDSAPSLTFSPATLDFGIVTITHTVGPKTLTITNSGGATLDLQYLHMEGQYRGLFGIVSNTCGGTLAAGSSCALGILFTAEYKGPQYAFVYVESNSPNSPQTAEVVAYGIN